MRRFSRKEPAWPKAGLSDPSARDREPREAAGASVPTCRTESAGRGLPSIDGIIKKANEVAGEVKHESVLDAALIAAAQAVEHYEITR
jgi:hypothetical protein